MGKKKKQPARTRLGTAPQHKELINKFAHVFVDDQNLFYGAVNKTAGLAFRIDFGELLNVASRKSSGEVRATKSAYIAGVVPDDDSFWLVAESQGFSVHRGFLGAQGRSKQDDAHLITQMTKVLYTEPGPSTLVLVAGDADYGPPLAEAIKLGWRVEIAFHESGMSRALEHLAHEIRVIHYEDFKLLRPRGYGGK